MLPTRKLYTSELELADEDIPAFLDWYAFRHAPDIYQAGFDNATSYRCVEGEMSILDLYEIGSVDLFERPEYKMINVVDPYSADVLAKRKDKTHTIYSHLFAAPEPMEDRPLLNADWISVFRFDAQNVDPADIVAHLATHDSERLLNAGARRVRLFSRSKGHPRLPSKRPRFLILSEWADRPADGDATPGVAARFATELSNTSAFIGHRLYPWPDRKEHRTEFPR